MAKTYESYIWKLAVENLDADEIRQCAEYALASMPPWEADTVRAAMAKAQDKIKGFGEMSAAEFFMAWAVHEAGRE